MPPPIACQVLPPCHQLATLKLNCCNLRPFAGEDVDEEIGEACEKEREKEGKEELANGAAQDCTIGAKKNTEKVERRPQWFYQAMIFVLCHQMFSIFLAVQDSSIGDIVSQ